MRNVALFIFSLLESEAYLITLHLLQGNKSKIVLLHVPQQGDIAQIKM